MFFGWIGLIVAGCTSGSFTVPGRGLRVMSWDGAWMLYSTVGMLLVPTGLGLLLAPVIFSEVFPQHWNIVGGVFCAGLMFGCGSFLFGISVERLGVALSNAIVSGTVALVGSLSPLVADSLNSSAGAPRLTPRDWLLLLSGLFILAAGIAASCVASWLRDRSAGPKPGLAAAKSGAVAGVLLALFAGCLSSMLNAGFVYGQPLVDATAQQGVLPAVASLAVWIPVLGGGFIINAGGAHLRVVRRGEYRQLSQAPVSDWARAVAMGILWSGALLIYGVCTQVLGSMGAIYGWAITVAASILMAILWGIWLGEWKAASVRAKLWLWSSLVLILVALAVLSIRQA